MKSTTTWIVTIVLAILGLFVLGLGPLIGLHGVLRLAVGLVLLIVAGLAYWKMK